MSEITSKSVLVINYGERNFQYNLKADSSTWNNDTYLNLIRIIKETYNLTESFSLYEKVCGEQFPIDDIDDLIGIFDDEDMSDDEESENDNITPHDTNTRNIFVKDREQTERELWKIDSFCLIFSRSKQQWFEGQIIEITGELHHEWLVVKYNQKTTKEIQRNSKDIKPIAADNVLSLAKGSKCLILSEYSNIWYLGEVLSILNDEEGEWLAIKYTENNLNKIADIQRYSKQLKVFNQAHYNDLVVKRQMNEHKEEKPDTMMARIQALHRMIDIDGDGTKEVQRLMNILSNILKSPFNSKYQSLLLNKLKKKFSKYPICIELLYDAGFKKSKNGFKLTFNINNMKLLKKTDKALKKQFTELVLKNKYKTNELKQRQAIAIAADAAANEKAKDVFSSLIDGSFSFKHGTDGKMGANWQKLSLFG